MINSSTANRTVGYFPISIGTSLAFESVCGLTTEAFTEPKDKVIQDYMEIWINVKTLFRNLLGSLDKTTEVLPRELAEVLLQEMNIIDKILNEYSPSSKIVYYINNYNLGSKFKNAVMREDHTPNQIQNAAIMRETLKQVLKAKSDILVFENKLKQDIPVNTLIITHFAYDLVSMNNFGKLTLLESHTGSVKGSDKWYTKYSNGKEIPFIPFMEGLLPVFGDNELFKPLNKESREAIIEIAKHYRWSAITSRDKVLYGIDNLKNPYLRTIVKSFFH